VLVRQRQEVQALPRRVALPRPGSLSAVSLEHGRSGARPADSYHRPAMADQQPTQPLDQQLQEIGAQLAWVRDYL
jgi:hypothetical protein